MTDRLYRIYALVDPTDSSVRYVGQTVKPLSHRLNGHIYKSKMVQTHSASWIKSLTDIGLKPSIIELESGIWNQETSDMKEVYWISLKKSEGCRLTNHTPGGNADNSHQLTEQYRKQHSERMKKWHQENPDKTRKSGTYKHPDSTKQTISQKSKDLWKNPDYRLKVSLKKRVTKATKNNWLMEIV